MMTIEDIEKTKCTGCLGCISVCPQQAIDCDEDEEGFYIPKLNHEKCVNCGKCYLRCPVNVNMQQEVTEDSFLAQLKDKRMSKDSASGGTFIGMAYYFMKQYDGIVVGAASIDGGVRHFIVRSDRELKRLQNSKYVQSYTGDIYAKVKANLKSERYVLFSGTPCQIAGLYSVVNGDERQKLFTVDLVCHGVPSPKFLRMYLRENSKTWQRKVMDYKFRVKKNKSKSHYMMMMMMMIGPPVLRPAKKDLYFALFLQGMDFRESCYKCKYATTTRVADITIGDCDSIEFYPDFHPEESNSIILLNSDKGRIFWKNGLNELFDYTDLDLDREAEYNHQLKHPFSRPALRDDIYAQIYNGKWDELTGIYCEKEGRLERCKWLFILYTPEFVIKGLSKIKHLKKGKIK